MDNRARIRKRCIGAFLVAAFWFPNSCLAVNSNHVFRCTPEKADDGKHHNELQCNLIVSKTPALEQKSTFCFEENGKRICVESKAKVTVEDIKEVPSDETKGNKDGGSAATAAISDDATVGNHVYKHPFTSYSADIRSTLEQYLKAEGDSAYEKAQIVMRLGMLHRTSLERGGFSKEAYRLTLNALKASQKQLEYLKNNQHFDEIPSNESMELYRHALANIYFSIGETFSLSPDPEQVKLSDEYYLQAHQTFVKLLEENSAYIDSSAVHREIELAWAHCCVRLGVAALAPPTSDESTKQQQQTLSEEELQERLKFLSEEERSHLEAYPEQIAELFPSILAAGTNPDHAKKSLEYFQSATHVYRMAAKKEKDPDTLRELNKNLANALQNLGTASMLLGDLNACASNNEQALALYEVVRKEYVEKSIEHEDMILATAELLHTLAEVHLQLGHYDKSQSHYARAMEWYEEHDLIPPPSAEAIGVDGIMDDSVETLKQTMDDYYASVSGDQEWYEDGAQEVYEQDYGYEGDLHASLGAMHVARGDLTEGHLVLLKAVELYKQAGESDTRTIADVYFNLASLTFRSASFSESTEYHKQALGIYRQVVPEGENPLDVLGASVHMSTTTTSHQGDDDMEGYSEADYDDDVYWDDPEDDDDNDPYDLDPKESAETVAFAAAMANANENDGGDAVQPMVVMHQEQMAAILAGNTTDDDDADEDDADDDEL